MRLSSIIIFLAFKAALPEFSLGQTPIELPVMYQVLPILKDTVVFDASNEFFHSSVKIDTTTKATVTNIEADSLALSYTMDSGSQSMTIISPNNSVLKLEIGASGNILRWVYLEDNVFREVHFSKTGEISSSFCCDYSVCNNCVQTTIINNKRTEIHYRPFHCGGSFNHEIYDSDCNRKKAIRVRQVVYYDDKFVSEELIPYSENVKPKQ